ncbi:phosphate starvation-inducible protein PhoH [Eubacterium maltosivorans]|uniref:PhoH-like protein n=1 Tax=Eubacterium maltosivorans TaxID=2041044 RepID=A0A4P9C883_EUBML|nr:PhoH family protein [Eubacterium maltosivorans]QCT70971.1 PhoH family protein [Eubacterium maltosivorans]WPK79628.1 PhoH-like protein [Eubacterium maltosivorans]SDP07410.1 phosphate starvation-inducible protein PhoH [Eubacterium maltosivorans]
MEEITKDIMIESPETMSKVFGKYDENIKLIEERLKVDVMVRGGALKIRGESRRVEAAVRVVEEMIRTIAGQGGITKDNTEYILTLQSKGLEKEYSALNDDIICYTMRGKPIRSKTLGQKRYIDAIRHNDIVFGIGPAGTGKTYLAMAMAITAFKNGEVDRLILTRPAVEAGEKLGFLPGDLQDKVDPYLRPLYDALFEIMGAEAFEKNMEKGLIEVAPLAYMRGRTLENAYIILDEAQNTTPEQMKMFLTRFGQGSKIVVTGDITQIDLPGGKRSGLKEVRRILRGIQDIAFIEFSQDDVVRHRLVQRIIEAYDRNDKAREKKLALELAEKPD